MAQHDFNIANAGGATVRADINNVLAAIQSSNSGTGAPSSTVAGMLWLDTSGGLPYALKIRDGGNNHWLTIGTVDDPGSDKGMEIVPSKVKLPSTGGVFESDGSTEILTESSGAVTLKNTTLDSTVVFPAGMVLQTVGDNYNSQTEASSEVKVCELTFTTKRANSKLAYWFTTAVGGFGDDDNLHVTITLQTGTSATNSSSNYLPTDNRGPGTSAQTNGFQISMDALVESDSLAAYNVQTYTASDLIVTSHAAGTQLTMGAFIRGGGYINRSQIRANQEGGVTTLLVQEIAT